MPVPHHPAAPQRISALVLPAPCHLMAPTLAARLPGILAPLQPAEASGNEAAPL
jgi:hypothetical protein